jgi:hypothetical protein
MKRVSRLPLAKVLRVLADRKSSRKLLASKGWRVVCECLPAMPGGAQLDLLAVNGERVLLVAVVEPHERLPVLLGIRGSARLAELVAKGVQLQLHVWSRGAGKARVEVVELTAKDFLK